MICGLKDLPENSSHTLEAGRRDPSWRLLVAPND
jgi:hypothetical protein